MLAITQIETPAQIEAVRWLVREFTEFAISQHPSARDTPAFAGLEAELAGLPRIFGPPDGAFLLATIDDTPAGCVEIRPREDDVCEVKRMYVLPAFRGQKLGEALTDALISKARALGYRKIVLDSFHTLKAAHHIYRKAGFADVAPTFLLPADLIGKVIFMEMTLD